MKANFLFTAGLLLMLMIACDKETTTNNNSQPPQINEEEEQPGEGPYSGTWTGTYSVRDSTEFCTFVDSIYTTTQEWKVVGDSVTIKEKVESKYDKANWTWSGIIKNDTLDIVSKRNTNCFGSYQTIEVLMKAVVTSTDDKYEINTTIIYAMCPPDCIFIFTYYMSKAR